MKIIKSALLGTKSLIDTNEEVILIQLKEILKEHREEIIDRLLRDIPTYLAYKFNSKPDKDLIEYIKPKLVSLKKSNVDLDEYKLIVRSVLSNPSTHLTNEPFYKEIDQLMSAFIESKKSTFNLALHK